MDKEELLNNPLFITFINKSGSTEYKYISSCADKLLRYINYKKCTLESLPVLSVDELKEELVEYKIYLQSINPKLKDKSVVKIISPVRQYYKRILGVEIPKNIKYNPPPDSFKYKVFQDYVKGLKKDTKRQYGRFLDKYMQWSGKTLDELLETKKNTDGILEEIDQYKIYLSKTINSTNKINEQTSCIKRFYKHYDLINTKNTHYIYHSIEEIGEVKELQQIRIERNLKQKTFNGYLVALKKYANFHKMTIEELLDEARHDEETIHLRKNRTIKSRLLKFRSYLINDNTFTSNTIKHYFTKIEAFYNHFEIEIPTLPAVKLEKEYKASYNDLPTKEHIRMACEISNLQFKALILFMSSSGTARAETLSLTVKDFIKGCKDYTNNTSIRGALQELQQRNDIVPTLYLKRIKTDKYYYTFCSPEASTYIIKELLYRNDIQLEDSLFNLTENQVLTYFQKINDGMKWGRVGKYRFFRSHVLRKYHASNIGLPPNIIDELEGRSKNIVHEAYIKTNPGKLKQAYIKSMHNVMIGINDSIEVKQNTQPIQKTKASNIYGKKIPNNKISYFHISNYEELF